MNIILTLAFKIPNDSHTFSVKCSNHRRDESSARLSPFARSNVITEYEMRANRFRCWKLSMIQNLSLLTPTRIEQSIMNETASND